MGFRMQKITALAATAGTFALTAWAHPGHSHIGADHAPNEMPVEPFAAAAAGGLFLAVALGAYAWHRSSRGPQARRRSDR